MSTASIDSKRDPPKDSQYKHHCEWIIHIYRLNHANTIQTVPIPTPCTIKLEAWSRTKSWFYNFSFSHFSLNWTMAIRSYSPWRQDRSQQYILMVETPWWWKRELSVFPSVSSQQMKSSHASQDSSITTEILKSAPSSCLEMEGLGFGMDQPVERRLPFMWIGGCGSLVGDLFWCF